jgi:hypothetical protein
MIASSVSGSPVILARQQIEPCVWFDYGGFPDDVLPNTQEQETTVFQFGLLKFNNGRKGQGRSDEGTSAHGPARPHVVPSTADTDTSSTRGT